MPEQPILNESGVLVTRTRVVVNGARTYPISGITAVRRTKTLPARSGAYILGALGVVVMLAGMGNASVLAIVVGFVAIVLAVLLRTKQKPKYHLVFNTAGINQQVFTSEDRELVRRITDAISEAVIARG